MLDPFTPAELDALLRCESPLLIGVRHHSAALSRATPALLDAFQPTQLFVELPPEFSEWTAWLGHEDLSAPIALAASEEGSSLCFYPFADFSPELAAIRWAARNDVPIELFDLPLEYRSSVEDEPATAQDEETPQVENTQPTGESPTPRGLLARLLARTQASDVGELWEELVESPGQLSEPDAIRRAGLLFGIALRLDDGQASAYDRARETHMRKRIETVGAKRAAAIIGSYHAAALLPEPMLWEPNEVQPKKKGDKADRVSTALIPYTFEQLDDRSGYPAGVRDPAWRQRVWAAQNEDQLDSTVADVILEVCRELREKGYPFHTADAKEALRMTRDLAGLRGLPVPGRRELLESLETCLTRGEVAGVGRAVAQAMQSVLVGDNRGGLPTEAPRSGLPVSVEALLESLKLPGPETLSEEPKRMRLDALRSRLDRARATLFQQLAIIGAPYASFVDGDESGDRETLTELWDVGWQHATAAALELNAALGATIDQATRGAIERGARLVDPDTPETTQLLARLAVAARGGVGDIVTDTLQQLSGAFAAQAGLPEITAALNWMSRIRAGHIPALPLDPSLALPPVVKTFKFPDEVSSAPLLSAAIARIEGLLGSDKLEDAGALMDLVLWHQQQAGQDDALDVGRLLYLLKRADRDGSPLMQGACVSAQLLLGDLDNLEFGRLLAGWASAATTRDIRKALRDRLRGAITVAAPRLTSDLECLEALEDLLAELNDDEFLSRAISLRGGFDVMAPNARNRLLAMVLERFNDSVDEPTATSPETALHRARAESAGRAAVEALFDGMPGPAENDNEDDHESNLETSPEPEDAPKTANGALPLAARWKLILGAAPDQLPEDARRVARSLDELYGLGSGEGAARCRAEGGRGGREAPFPSVRDWDGELSELFSADVREEILSQAAEQGRAAALLQLNPESVTPSVELLRDTLALQGGLPPTQAAHLRKIADRVIEDLTRELANKLRPAMFGITSARPTLRRTGKLDLPRTIRRNLHTAYADESGDTKIIPERLVFRAKAKRSIEWEIIFVVDVSGSMEASVIYSAIMAAILAGLPAIDVQFLAFSTKVIDFTDHVEDPLELLLEVQVGGGTSISKGLRAAREKLRVPARSIVVVITDFEEGGPIGDLLAEVKALTSTGAKCLGLAALDDAGKPRYNHGVAQQVANAGMAVAALSPQQLARWMGEQIQ